MVLVHLAVDLHQRTFYKDITVNSSLVMTEGQNRTVNEGHTLVDVEAVTPVLAVSSARLQCRVVSTRWRQTLVFTLSLKASGHPCDPCFVFSSRVSRV